jgi:hypothetical protein
MNKEMLRLIGAATGGLLIGSGATYLIVNNRLAKKYNAIAREEVATVHAIYKTLNEDSITGEEYVEQVLAAQNANPDPRAEGEGVVSTRLSGAPVFAAEPTDNATPEQILDWKERLQDYQGTLSEPGFARVTYEKPENPQAKADAFFEDRDANGPYLISVEEYQEQNDNLTKAQLVYYEGDGILVDERDIPVEDVDFLVGPDALNNFGNHSDDDDIVYVRREQSDTDFEIVKDPRSFENKFNQPGEDSKGPIRRMRDDD